MHCSIPISMAQNKGELLGYARSVIPFSSWFWTKLRYLWNCDVCPHWFRQLIRWFLLALICDSSTSICNSKNRKLASLSPKLWKAVGTESQSAMRVRDLHHDRLCLIQKLLYIYILRGNAAFWSEQRMAYGMSENACTLGRTLFGQG